MPPADRDHGREAMTNGMGKGFDASMTSMALFVCVIPFASGLIGGKKVKSGTVDKSPVTEVYSIT